jgi:hypothetical protein
MLAPLANQTVTRLRGTSGTDGYGDAGTSWASPARLVIGGCSFQPEQGEEILTDRSAVVSRWRWYGPPAADVQSSDRLEVDGIAYDIDGSVQKWTGLGLDHQTALCRRTDG